MPRKIVINARHGGYELSKRAKMLFEELAREADGGDDSREARYRRKYPERDDPNLVRVVECLGSEQASGRCAYLEVIEIPDDVEWEIMEYDGMEWVAEKHRTWRGSNPYGYEWPKSDEEGGEADNEVVIPAAGGQRSCESESSPQRSCETSHMKQPQQQQPFLYVEPYSW